MLYTKPILVVLMNFFLLFNASVEYKLNISNFPTFKYSSNLNFYSDAKMTFDDPSRYKMRKLLLTPDELVIIINYTFEKETVLAKRISELNTFAWIYVDKLNPFKIMSYKVNKKTPEKILQMIEMIPYGKTTGINDILEKLNTIDWDKELFKKFFKTSSFSRMHLSSRSQMKQQIEFIRLMMGNIDHQTRPMFNYQEKLTNDQRGFHLKQYKEKLVEFFKDMVRKIFYHFSGMLTIDIFSNLIAQNKLNDFEYPKMISNIIPLLDNFKEDINQDIEEYRKDLDTFFDGDLPEYYFEYEELQDIYNEKIHPIFTGKLYPFFSILFQKIKMAETRKNLKKVLSNLYLEYKFSVFLQDSNSQFRNYRIQIVSEYCFKLLKMYRKKRFNFSKLNKFLTKNWIKMSKILLKKIAFIPKLEMNIVREAIKYHTRKFSDLFLSATPLEVSFYDSLSKKFFIYSDTFQNSEIYEREIYRLKNKELLDKFIELCGLLGGRSYVEPTKSVVFNVFHLTKEANIETDEKILL